MEPSQNFQYSRINVTHKKTDPYEVIIAVVLPLIGISISFIYNYVGAALVVLGLWIFIKHFLGKRTLITRLLPEHPISLKLLTFNKTNTAQKNILVLLPEIFYQSNLSSKLKEVYIKYLYVYTFSAVIAVFWLYLKPLIPSMSIYLAGNSFLFLLQITYFFLYSTIQRKMKVHSIIIGQQLINYLNNQNDLDNLHILFKPENSIHCMDQVIDQLSDQLNATNTLVINVSPYTAAYNQAIMEEGVIFVKDYFEYRESVKKINLPTASNRYYISELLPFRNQGFFGISFACSGKSDCYPVFHDLLKEIVVTD